MKNLAVLFFSIVSTPFAFSQDWNTIQIFSPDQTIQGLAMGRGDTIMASSSLYNGTALNIKRTNDNGVSWAQEYTGYTSQSFREMATSDSTNFFSIANAGILIGNSGTTEWNPVGVPISENLRCIFFLNNSIGFIGADAGKIIKTIDGGLTWASIPDGSIGSINEIHFLDEMNGIICGFNFFRRTIDGGATWFDITGFESEYPSYQLNEIDFASSNIGYVCGDIGYLYKTTDGGINWVQQVTDTESSLQSIDVLSDNKVFACGFDNTILQTIDGGLNWNSMASDQSEHYRGIQFNETGGFIVTQLGKVLNYPLPDASLSSNGKLDEIIVYPNPTRAYLNLNIPNEWQVIEISITEVNGRQVKRFTDKNQFSNLNLSELNTGFYFVNIRTVQGAFSKSVMKY